MTPAQNLSTPLRMLLGLAALVIVAGGIQAAQSIVVPFLLSVFIAIICEPPLTFLQRRGMPVWLALLAVIGGVVAVLLAAGALLGDSVAAFSSALPFYEKRLGEQGAHFIAWLGGLGLQLNADDILKYLDPAAAVKLVGRFVNSLGGVLANAFLIFLTVIFILLEAARFPAKLAAIVQTPGASLAPLRECMKNINRYLAIKTLTSLATGAGVSAGLALAGVDFALLWGMLAFFLNYIPAIGSFIAAAPAILLALVQLGPGGGVAALAVFLAVNIVIGNFIEPRLMGKSLGLSTLVVFLSLVFWGWLLGPVGMFLSAPLTMVTRIALDASRETRWLGVLLSADAPPPGRR